MTRSVVLAVLLCAGASAAHADSMTLPNGATITFNRLFLHEHNNPDLVQPEKTPDSLWAYFNYAHCVCSQFVEQCNANPGTPCTVDPMTFHESTFAYELLLQPPNAQPLVHRPLEIWVGSSCDQDAQTRMTNCHQITGAGTNDISSIGATGGITPEVPVYDLMVPAQGALDTTCGHRVLSAAEWGIADGDGDGTPDFFVSQSIDTDSLPPWGPTADVSSTPLPTDFKANGAENAIEISWTPTAGDTTDIAYYQALCATMDDAPAITNPPKPRYITPLGLCGAPESLQLKPVPIDAASASARTLPAAPDGGVDAAGDAGDAADADIDAAPDDADTGTTDAGSAVPEGVLGQVPAAYICAEVTDPTATSIRIEGLQNGTPYKVALLAIDKYGNAGGVFFTSYLTPKAVTDVWEDLHDRGSKVKGGFCLLAETYGDGSPLTQALRSFRDDNLASTAFGRALVHAYYGSIAGLGAYVHGHLALRILAGVLLLPLVAIALLWHLLTLPGLLGLLALGVLIRRRRLAAARAAAAAAALVCVLAPGRARAQAPYWEDPMAQQADGDTALDQPARISWHFGVRVGPYMPQIDDQFQAQTMTTGKPFQDMFGKSGVLPVFDLDRVLWRGVGQLGVGLSLGYMSWSAHAWADCGTTGGMNCMPGDPDRMRSDGDTNSFHLIPLAVSAIYRFTTLDDEYGIPLVPYARAGLGYYIWWIDAPSGDLAKVGGDKAAGASLGFVGSLGLAIRAERIDAAAARSMRESGIEHAGFFGELSLGKVDGFGKSTKLSVGDTTWFAGVDFEF